MFKKTIAVLLLLSIVLSSCGKKDKDKSNDFVRVVPESPVPAETSTLVKPLKSSTPAPASTSTTHSRFMYYWHYEMYNFHGFAITTKGVVLTAVSVVISVGSVYKARRFVYFLCPIFFRPRNHLTVNYGDKYYCDNIFGLLYMWLFNDWLGLARCIRS